jgi:hypothetical protein
MDLFLTLSEARKSKVKASIDSVSGKGSFSVLLTVLSVSSHGGKSERFLWGLFYEDFSLIHEVFAFMIQSSSQVPTSKYQFIND